MARYFGKITMSEFKDEINKAVKKQKSLSYIEEDFDPNWKSLTPQIEKDLGKVEFDTENISIKDDYGWTSNKNLLGYQTLGNGMVLLGVNSGGDWEKAIYFCVFFDGKKLRGYIPTKGNTWNTINHIAVGNDEEKDNIFLKQHPEKENINCDLIVKDIVGRILPLDAVPKDVKKRITKLTTEQKLDVAIKCLKLYGNMDFWKYRNVCEIVERDDIVVDKHPRYTSLEVHDKDGIHDGWEWAEEALKKINA